MTSPICPYLGLKDDSKTVLDFPSDGNFCHRARPPAAVIRNQQQGFCLSENYTTCPVFLRAEDGPLPNELVGPIHRREKSRKLVYGSGLAVLLLVLGVALAAVWRNISAVESGSSTQPTQVNSRTVDNPSFDILMPQDENPAVTKTPVPEGPATATFPSNPSVTPCDIPVGWIPYTIKPTDSIFRLSLVFGVSVEELQKGNCMGDTTLIRAGEQIYVPNPPTSTPIPTFTPTNTRIYLSPTPKPTRTSKPYSKVPTSPPNTSPTEKPVGEPTAPPPVRPTSPPQPPTSAPPPPEDTQPAPAAPTSADVPTESADVTTSP